MGLFDWFQKKRPRIREVSLTNRGYMNEFPENAEVLYMLPKDIQEVNRLDFQHYLMRHALKANYLAPISQPADILDVAYGTGRWMLEMAVAFPQASVSGIDLTPFTSDGTAITFPANCTFLQGDILKGLPFTDQSFDFVHQRFLIFAIPLDNWPALMREIVRLVSPGGWIELVEPNLFYRQKGPYTTRILNWIKQASQKRGIDISIGLHLEQFMRQAGLVNVHVQEVPIPIGNWGGRLGNMLATDFSTAVQTIKPLVIRDAKVPAEEFDYCVDKWVAECDEYQTSCDFYIVYGQRL